MSSSLSKEIQDVREIYDGHMMHSETNDPYLADDNNNVNPMSSLMAPRPLKFVYQIRRLWCLHHRCQIFQPVTIIPSLPRSFPKLGLQSCILEEAHETDLQKKLLPLDVDFVRNAVCFKPKR